MQSEDYVKPYTVNQEVRALGWIARRFARLSPAGKRWLADWAREQADNDRR